jgi:hypothetical protein
LAYLTAMKLGAEEEDHKHSGFGKLQDCIQDEDRHGTHVEKVNPLRPRDIFVNVISGDGQIKQLPIAQREHMLVRHALFPGRKKLVSTRIKRHVCCMCAEILPAHSFRLIESDSSKYQSNLAHMHHDAGHDTAKQTHITMWYSSPVRHSLLQVREQRFERLVQAKQPLMMQITHKVVADGSALTRRSDGFGARRLPKLYEGSGK